MLLGKRLFLLALLLTACLQAAIAPTTASADEKATPLRRLAIMPLVNLKPDKDTDWLGVGTSETLTTNMMKVSGLMLVERQQLNKALLEQDLQKADFTDPKTAVRVGKIVGAERILVGSYAREGPSIIFNVRIIDVETSVVLHAASVQGEWTKIFDLMTQLASAVVDSFDKKAVLVDKRPTAVDSPQAERIVLTAEEAKRLADWGTTSRDAYEALSRGVAGGEPNGFGPSGFLSWYDNKTSEDLDRAIKHFDKAIQLDAKYARAYFIRGKAYSTKADNVRAIKDYDKAIELDPKWAEAYVNRGLRYMGTWDGGPDRAIKDYDKAIELDPKFAWAYLERASAYMGKGDNGRAIKDYDKAIELDPKWALAYLNRGHAYLGEDDYNRAIRDYDKGIDLDPADAIAYWFRGNAYAKKGDDNRAIKDYDKTIELDLKDAYVYRDRSKAYYRIRQYDKAWADVRTCQRLGGRVDAKFLADLRKASGRNG